jgi:hypothetical protein
MQAARWVVGAVAWAGVAVAARWAAPVPIPCDCGVAPWGMLVALGCVSGRAIPPRWALWVASAVLAGILLEPAGWIAGVRLLGPVLALTASATVLRERFVLACVTGCLVLVVTHGWEPYFEAPVLGAVVRADRSQQLSFSQLAFQRLVSRNDVPAILALLPATSGSYRSQLQGNLVARLGQAAAPILRQEIERADPAAQESARRLLRALVPGGAVR